MRHIAAVTRPAPALQAMAFLWGFKQGFSHSFWEYYNATLATFGKEQ